jgi:DNA repair protein RadC
MRYSLKTIRVSLTVEEPQFSGKVTSAADVERIARPIFATLDADQEHLVLLAMSCGAKVLGFKVLSSGGMSSSIVDPRVVFRNALLLGAASIIIVHNHPGGDIEASGADLAVTKKIHDCGEMLGCALLDSIILGEAGHNSLVQTHRQECGW